MILHPVPSKFPFLFFNSVYCPSFEVNSVLEFINSMRVGKRVGIGLSYRPSRQHMAGEIDSLESILGLFRSSKIWALVFLEKSSGISREESWYFWRRILVFLVKNPGISREESWYF
jgi:hypothetical protein